MHAPAAAEPGTLPTLLQRHGWGDSGWNASTEEVVLPGASTSPRRRRNGGVRGIGVSAAALAAVAAVAATYLALRCALYLAKAHQSRAALRFLSGAERATNEYRGEPCGAPADDPPAAAAPAGVKGGEGKVPLEEDLLKRSHRYASNLRQFISRIEPLVTQLNTDLKAKSIATLLCCSVVELSALFCLLEVKERDGLRTDIYLISRLMWRLRDTLDMNNITKSRERHIKCLHQFLTQLTNVKPASAAFEKGQRQDKLHKLLSLQEVALGQLNAGLATLQSLESSQETNDDVKAAAAFESAAVAAEGAVVAAESHAPAANAAANGRVADVVENIQLTVHTRREQVLLDPVLSDWLRKVHTEDVAYGIARKNHLQRIFSRPLPTHDELLKTLQATPLGSGGENSGHTLLVAKDVQEKAAASSARKTPSQGGKVPSKRPDRASRASGPLKRRQQGSTNSAGATGPISAPPNMPTPAATAAVSTVAPGAALPEAADAERNHANSRHPNGQETVPPLAAPNVIPQVSLPAAAGRPQVSALAASLESVAVSPAGYRSVQATWGSAVSNITSVGKSSDYSESTEALPRLPSSSSTATLSAAAAYYPETFILPTPDDDANASFTYSASDLSWASLRAPDVLSAYATSHTSQASPAQTLGGFDRSPAASNARYWSPVQSFSHLYANPTLLPYSAATAQGWPLQATGADENEVRGAGMFMSGPSGSLLQTDASQRLAGTPWRPENSPPSLVTAEPEGSVDIYGRSNNFQEWGPFGRAPQRPTDELLTNKETVGPSAADIDAGFEALAKLFSGAASQQLSEGAQPRPRQRVSATPSPDAAAAALARVAGAHSFPYLESDNDIR